MKKCSQVEILRNKYMFTTVICKVQLRFTLPPSSKTNTLNFNSVIWDPRATGFSVARLFKHTLVINKVDFIACVHVSTGFSIKNSYLQLERSANHDKKIKTKNKNNLYRSSLQTNWQV